MANSPAAPPGGQYRVVRTIRTVQEIYVTAATAALAKAAARAAPEELWYVRDVPMLAADNNPYEYDVVDKLSDDAA